MEEETGTRKLPIRGIAIASVALLIVAGVAWLVHSQRQETEALAAHDRFAECKAWRIKDPKQLEACSRSAAEADAIIEKLKTRQRQGFWQGYTQNSTMLAKKLPPIDKSAYREASVGDLHEAGIGRANATPQDLAPVVERFGPKVRLKATIMANQLPGRVKKGQLPKYTLALLAASPDEPTQAWMIPAHGGRLNPFEQQFLLFFCTRKSLITCNVEVFGDINGWKTARSANAPLDTGLILDRVVFPPVDIKELAAVPSPRAAFVK